MKYTIEGFSQLEAVKLGLDVNDLCILRWIVDFSQTGKMVNMQVEGKTYFWIKYEAVMEDLPILAFKTKDALYRRLKKMVNCGVLEHKVIKQAGVFSMYRLGQSYEQLISDKLMGTDIKPNETDGKSKQNINLLNKSTKSKNSLSKDKESSALDKSKIISEVYSNPDNAPIIDALRRYQRWRRDNHYGYHTNTFVKWAKFLRKECLGNPDRAMAIVDQSIKKDWKDLYPLKDTDLLLHGRQRNPEQEIAVDDDGNPIVY